LVTSAAEALVGEFYESIKHQLPSPPFTLSITQLSRLLMRHPKLSSSFAVCLQFYMTTLDQSRGNRNPSYKQMTIAVTQKNQSFRRFTQEFVAQTPLLLELYGKLSNLHEFHFHPFLVDWHSIAGQLPEVHRHFELPGFNRNILIKRARGDDARPPWAVGRAS
jgi:hypothetical protein